MRRKLTIFVLCFGLAGVGAAAWLFWPQPPIDEASIGQIELGMTRDEVVAILARPRNESLGQAVMYGWSFQDDILRRAPHGTIWVGHKDAVTIDFEDGCVARLWIGVVVGEEETMFQKLRRWLNL
jgi:hypothetical protein